MDKRAFGRRPLGEVLLDVCWPCSAIWFDQFESTQLTPASVIALFRLIHEHREPGARPLADRMTCPACPKYLVFTQDLQRTNRISYYRCPEGHGRLTTFFQFLREKQFVRSLSSLEIETLKATVKQVRCSGCGAPIDLARDSACSFCRSPLSILDPDAVGNALADLSEAERKRTRPNPQEISAAFDSLIATHKNVAKAEAWRRNVPVLSTGPVLADLVVEGIAALFD